MTPTTTIMLWGLSVAPAAGDPVLHETFDETPKPATSGTDTRLHIRGKHRCVPSPSGRALIIDASTRLEVDPNVLHLDEGTIAMRIRADWDWQQTDRIHCLFQFSGDKWRSHMMRLTYWPHGRNRLRLEVRHAKRLNVDGHVSDWRRDAWHHVAVAWRRRPGEGQDEVWLYGDGRLLASSQSARLPTKTGPWLFVGGNQNAPPKNEAFGGAIDELWVYDKALSSFEAHGVAPVRLAQRRDRQSEPWARPHRYRLDVSVPPTKRRWADAPVLIKVDPSMLARELGLAPRDLAYDSVLVAFVTEGEAERPVAHKLDFEPGCWRICWRSPVPSDRARRFRVYLDRERRPGVGPPPAFVGACDALTYGRSGVVDRLGMGLWACPAMIDYNRDGKLDLLYSCADVPVAGTYLFERLPGKGGGLAFRLAGRLHGPHRRLSVCDWNGDGNPDVLVSGGYYDDVRRNGFERYVAMPVKRYVHPVRAYIYRAADWDADGTPDLLVSCGDWREYGWDRGFDERGEWKRGPLHGWVRFFRNGGTAAAPKFGVGHRLMAGHWPVDVFGRPGVCVVDWDSDGDLDLLIGEFLDRISYFQNVGSRSAPRLAPGRFLTVGGRTLRMDLCMIMPTTCDYDGDGDVDLIVGEEDGYVDLVANTAGKGRTPQLSKPVYLTSVDLPLKSGGLAVPSAADWDGDGDTDVLVGNTAGYLELFVNDGSDGQPRFRRAGYLSEQDGVIRIQAGYNGSVQGPCETKWGYTVPAIVDWDGDGKLDVIANSIIGRLMWWRRVAKDPTAPLENGKPLRVKWPSEPPYPKWNWWRPGYDGFDSAGWGAAAKDELVTQWRTRPQAADLNGDGLLDLVSLDHEGYLAVYYRSSASGHPLLPSKRVFVDDKDRPLRLSTREGGGSGRVKLCLVDWDRDGDLDVLKNTRNVCWYENVTNKGDAGGKIRLVGHGDLVKRRLAGHTSSPEAVDLNRDGWPDILLGAEDGRLYCIHRAFVDDPPGCVGEVMMHTRR